jgi:hypothetical protein
MIFPCQNAVCYDQVYDLFLVRMPYVTISNSYIQIDCCVHIVFDQVYDLLLVKTLYVTKKFMICYWSEPLHVTTKFMICFWSEHCMVWQSLWFVTGKNTVWYDQVYDLLPVKTLYSTTKFIICYFSQRHMLRKVIVTYKLNAVFILYSTKFMIGYWSEHCMLGPSLWFVTGQNAVCYDQVYDLLLVKTLNGMTKFMICYFSERHILW